MHSECCKLAPAKVQTGTTFIIYPLRNGSPNAVRLKPILERQQKCDMISFADLRPTRSQARDTERHILLQIIQILLSNEEGFSYMDQTDPLFKARSYRPPPSEYKTDEFVMRTTTIDEGSTEGNIEVARDQYFVQLDFDKHDPDDRAILAIRMLGFVLHRFCVRKTLMQYTVCLVSIALLAGFMASSTSSGRFFTYTAEPVSR
jgi:hypothetical protein